MSGCMCRDDEEGWKLLRKCVRRYEGDDKYVRRCLQSFKAQEAAAAECRLSVPCIVIGN